MLLTLVLERADVAFVGGDALVEVGDVALGRGHAVVDVADIGVERADVAFVGGDALVEVADVALGRGHATVEVGHVALQRRDVAFRRGHAVVGGRQLAAVHGLLAAGRHGAVFHVQQLARTGRAGEVHRRTVRVLAHGQVGAGRRLLHQTHRAAVDVVTVGCRW
jgi:hypothetical protein